MWKSWISGGFVYIGDLFVDDLYVTLDQLERVLGKPRGQFMFQYFALYNTLPIAWRQPQEIVDFNPDVLVYCGRNVSAISNQFIRKKQLEKKKKNCILC